jgi:hypothetical protein
VRKLEYWKITALIGAIIFLISAFLPWISLSLFDMTSAFNLINTYTSLGQSSSTGSVTVSSLDYGILLTIILYPITAVLGFASIMKRSISLAAGILGIICWIGCIVTLASYNYLQFAGLGIFVGIIGSIILIIAYSLKPHAATPQATIPPPPPVQ